MQAGRDYIYGKTVREHSRRTWRTLPPYFGGAAARLLVECMTIKEIAALVGTSRGTVDRVLNGRGNVRPELADQVRRIAKEHGYKPNKLAQALVNSQKHWVIGIIINSVSNPFFDDVLQGIRARAEYYKSHGLTVLIREIRGYDEQEQLEVIRQMKKDSVDALGITPLDYPSIAQAVNELDVPVVTFNTDAESVRRLAFVGCDYLNSGRLSGDMVKLLLPGGGKVGVVIGNSHILGHLQRVEGLRSSLAGEPSIEIVDVVENSDDDERSYEVTKKLILDQSPDLVYFASAGIQGGVQAVRDLGTPCKVITVDDTDFIREGLNDGIIAATVTQEPDVQGSRTVDILYNCLANHIKPDNIMNYTNNHVKLRSSK